MKISNTQLCFDEKKLLLDFEELFHKTFPRLRNFANHLLHNATEAEDLVQESFILAWEKRNELEKISQLEPYLYTLVRNRCFNKLKHDVVKRKFEAHQVGIISEELYHISFASNENFVSIQEEITRQLDQLIEMMPPKCGMVFKLKWIEGKKHREIAELLNISMTMVDKHLAKGLEFAKQRLSPELLFFLLFVYNQKIPFS